jgi:hypothetical protein
MERAAQTAILTPTPPSMPAHSAQTSQIKCCQHDAHGIGHAEFHVEAKKTRATPRQTDIKSASHLTRGSRKPQPVVAVIHADAAAASSSAARAALALAPPLFLNSPVTPRRHSGTSRPVFRYHNFRFRALSFSCTWFRSFKTSLTEPPRP